MNEVMNGEKTQAQKVKDLCKNIIPYFEATYFNKYISDYKMALWYKLDRELNPDFDKEWQSNIFFPMIPTLIDTIYSSIYDSKFNFNVVGDWLEWTDKLLNRVFDYQWLWREHLMDTAKECIITWRGYLKPYFISYMDTKKVKKKILKKKIKRPAIQYKSVFNVFYDYSGKFEDSSFIIERNIMNRKAIIKTYWSKIENIEARLDAIIRDKTTDRYSDFDVNRVKHLIYFEEVVREHKFDTWIPTKHSMNRWHTDAWDINNKNNLYYVDFTKQQVFEVIEYTDDDVVTVLIDWKELFTAERKITFDWPTIQCINYNTIPWSSDSQWISSMNTDIQLVINSLINIFLDNLKMWIAPMFEVVWWLNNQLIHKGKIKYSPYKMIATNMPNWVRKLDLSINWYEPVNAIQFLSDVTMQRAWVSEYMMWVQGKVERISWWVDALSNAFKSRLLPLVNSIQKAMGNIAKILLLFYANYYTDQELKDLWLIGDIDYEKLLDEKGITFMFTSLNLLQVEEKLKYLNENLWTIFSMAQWPNGKPNFNSKELLRWILNKDIDTEAILDTSKIEQPQQQFGWFWWGWFGWWQPQQEDIPEEDIYSALQNIK